MGYRLMGWTTARAMRLWDRIGEQRGQGTVEYVGIVVMVALLVSAVGVVASKWGGDVGDKLKDGLIKAIKKLVVNLVA
jgi:hypothetical protein